ncbi:MAG: DUF4364 family protein, partial [Clostridiales bacterium]|nr:DUF4364 family protein [Clostridiales bacterium]
EVVENKLILLYTINKLNLPVSNLQLIKLVLENRFMNYFQLQQNLDELERNGSLARTVTGGRSAYGITDSGVKTLQLLSAHLSAGFRARIDDVINSGRKNLREEILVKADFIPENEHDYTASCSVGEEDFPLMKLEVAAGSRNEARAICENWKKHSQDIYAEIIEALTKKRS